ERPPFDSSVLQRSKFRASFIAFPTNRDGATRAPLSCDHLASKYGRVEEAGRTSRVHVIAPEDLARVFNTMSPRGALHLKPVLSAQPNRSTGVRQFRDNEAVRRCRRGKMLLRFVDSATKKRDPQD